jgi:hypothetical protein
MYKWRHYQHNYVSDNEATTWVTYKYNSEHIQQFDMHDTKNILLAFTLKQLYKGLNN